MKILLVQNEYSKSALGGASLLCHDIVQALVQRGNGILVLCAGPETDAAGNIHLNLHHIKQANDVRELQTIWARAGWLLTSRHNYQATRRAINTFNPDVVYLHNLEWVTFSPLRAAMDSGKRVVLHAHNHDYAGLFRPGHAQGARLNNLIFKTGLGSERPTVIAISDHIAQEILVNSPSAEGTIFTIHNGIPDAAFGSIDHAEARATKALFAGAISSHKGVHVAIESVLLARKRGAPVELDIYGPPSNEKYLEHCRQLARSDGVQQPVCFKGPVTREELWQRMQEAMILLFPSLWEEPFGLVAAEAMANGAIVIGSNRGAIPEVVGDCGKCVEPTPEAFAQAICEVVSSAKAELTTLRSKARDRAKTHFSLNDRVLEIEAVLSLHPGTSRTENGAGQST